MKNNVKTICIGFALNMFQLVYFDYSPKEKEVSKYHK